MNIEKVDQSELASWYLMRQQLFSTAELSDIYDPYSKHYWIKHEDNRVGIVRVILPNPVGLYCMQFYPNVVYQQGSTAEISRLALAADSRAVVPLHRIALTVYMQLMQECRESGVSTAVISVEPRFARLLVKSGVNLTAISEPDTSRQPTRQLFSYNLIV